MKINVKGADEYAVKLSAFGWDTKRVIGESIYTGAGIVADAIKANIQSLPTVSEAQNIAAYKSGGVSGLSQRQKDGLLESLGITKMDERNGYYTVKVGFDGYNDISTEKYPKGQPNQMIARVVEGGSTYMYAHPFIKPALKAVEKMAEEKMGEIIDRELEKLAK